MVLAWQDGPFHLTLTQTNSEKNYIAKNKCPERQKLDARRKSRNLIAISPRDTQYIFIMSRCFAFFVLLLGPEGSES